ncbi:MAG: hypothetical protein JXA52_01655, partial [Planctomycetes bacterium]|nr:hypothetical protein [Planctomycetota bacterium]
MDQTEFPYKICIPYQDHARGGMYTFFNYFTQYLTRHGIAHTRKIVASYDFLLVNSFMTKPGKIWFAKKLFPRARIVQRVDGAAQDYGRSNGEMWDSLQGRVSRLADLTIYQSNYGKYATNQKFPVINSDGPVIYNAVDTELFNGSARQAEPGER